MSAKALCIGAVRPSVCSFVRLSGQILLPRYLMNGLRILDETYREYSLAPTDDLGPDLQKVLGKIFSLAQVFPKFILSLS